MRLVEKVGNQAHTGRALETDAEVRRTRHDISLHNGVGKVVHEEVGDDVVLQRVVHDLHVMAHTIAGGIAYDGHALMDAASHKTIADGRALSAAPEGHAGVEAIQYLRVLNHSGRIEQVYAISLGADYAAGGESQVGGVVGAQRAGERSVESRSCDLDGSRG